MKSHILSVYLVNFDMNNPNPYKDTEYYHHTRKFSHAPCQMILKLNHQKHCSDITLPYIRYSSFNISYIWHHAAYM